MKKEGNSYSKQISEMGNVFVTQKNGRISKIILSNKNNSQMSNIGQMLIWFVIFLVITIIIEYVAVLANLSKGMLIFMTYCFFFLIIVDGVIFITLLVVIINSIKRRGFE